jgi:phage-related protein
VVDLIGWVSSLPGRALAFFRALWSGAVALVRRLATDMVIWTMNAVNGAVHWFQQLPGRAVAEIKALPGQIKNVFANAGTWLLSAGKSVVMGLVNGIKDAAGAALGAVKDLGGNMISGFKSAMGISSPSRVFAETGRWIPAGIAQGITTGMPAVHSALAGVPTSLPPVSAAIGAIPAPRAPLGSGAGSYSGTSGDARGVLLRLNSGDREFLNWMRKVFRDSGVAVDIGQV